jgi:hypothetical protein
MLAREIFGPRAECLRALRNTLDAFRRDCFHDHLSEVDPYSALSGALVSVCSLRRAAFRSSLLPALTSPRRTFQSGVRRRTRLKQPARDVTLAELPDQS